MVNLLKGHLPIYLTKNFYIFQSSFLRCSTHSLMYVSSSEPQTGEETLLEEQLLAAVLYKNYNYDNTYCKCHNIIHAFIACICMHAYMRVCYRPLRFDDSIHRARRAAPSEQWCMVCMFAFIVVCIGRQQIALTSNVSSPVCGSDELTYINECVLQRKNCFENIKVLVKYIGRCPFSKFTIHAHIAIIFNSYQNSLVY